MTDHPRIPNEGFSFGDYGVCRSWITNAISRRNVAQVIVVCDNQRSQRLVRELGAHPHPASAHATRHDVGRSVLDGHMVAVHCAEYYPRARTALVAACLRTDDHYVEISVYRRHIQQAPTLLPSFQSANLTAYYDSEQFVPRHTCIGQANRRALGGRNMDTQMLVQQGL